MATANLDVISVLKNAIVKANDLGQQLIAAKSDPDAQVKAVIETSDDPNIVKFREARAKIQEDIATLTARLENGTAAITDHARTLVLSVGSDFDYEETHKAFLAARREANEARKALLIIGQHLPTPIHSDEDLDKVLAEAGAPTEVISIRGQRSGAGGGSGVRRPRISAATVNGAPVADEEGKVTFTSLTQFISKEIGKVGPNAVRDAAFAAAGTDDLSSLDPETVIEFTVTAGEHEVAVTVTTLPAK